MDDMTKLILDEVKENRKEISKLRAETMKEMGGMRTDVTSLKVKFGMIAVIFGFLGGFIKPIALMFLGGKS